jgi:hypothetical protein
MEQVGSIGGGWSGNLPSPRSNAGRLKTGWLRTLSLCCFGGLILKPCAWSVAVILSCTRVPCLTRIGEGVNSYLLAVTSMTWTPPLLSGDFAGLPGSGLLVEESAAAMITNNPSTDFIAFSFAKCLLMRHAFCRSGSSICSPSRRLHLADSAETQVVPRESTVPKRTCKSFRQGPNTLFTLHRHSRIQPIQTTQTDSLFIG